MRSFFLTVLFLGGLSLTACGQHGDPDRPAAAPTSGNPGHVELRSYPAASERITRTDAEWKAMLPAASYDVLRHAGTEHSFSGALLKEHRDGLFVCAGCGNPLFSSKTKFESGTGWPSFWAPIEPERVTQLTDRSILETRIEVRCARCGGHLGHVFDDGPKPTGLRYCMNSVALRFVATASDHR